MTFDSKKVMMMEIFDQREVASKEAVASAVVLVGQKMILAAGKVTAAQMKVAFEEARMVVVVGDADVDAAQIMTVAADEATAPQTITDSGEKMAFAAITTIASWCCSSLSVPPFHYFPRFRFDHDRVNKSPSVSKYLHSYFVFLYY